MNMNSRAMVMSVVIAGVVIGILSAIPLVNCLNCLLFAWVWLGGIGAVYLYRRYENVPTTTITNGLLLGGIAGAIGGLVGGLVSLITGGLGAAFSEMVNQLAGQSGVNVPSFLLSSGFSIIGVFTNIILYAVFGAIGGLIATALIWKAPVGPVGPVPPYTPPPAGPAV